MKFVIDNMLGKLCFFFRNVGIDAFYMKEKDIERLIDVAKVNQRIIVTKNKVIYGMKHGLPCFMPKSTQPEGFFCDKFSEIIGFIGFYFIF